MSKYNLIAKDPCNDSQKAAATISVRGGSFCRVESAGVEVAVSPAGDVFIESGGMTANFGAKGADDLGLLLISLGTVLAGRLSVKP